MTHAAATDPVAVGLVQSFSNTLALQKPHDASERALVKVVAEEEEERNRMEILKVNWKDLFIPSHR
jgi:hypothetical protein